MSQGESVERSERPKDCPNWILGLLQTQALNLSQEEQEAIARSSWLVAFTVAMSFASVTHEDPTLTHAGKKGFKSAQEARKLERILASAGTKMLDALTNDPGLRERYRLRAARLLARSVVANEVTLGCGQTSRIHLLTGAPAAVLGVGINCGLELLLHAEAKNRRLLLVDKNRFVTDVLSSVKALLHLKTVKVLCADITDSKWLKGQLDGYLLVVLRYVTHELCPDHPGDSEVPDEALLLAPANALRDAALKNATALLDCTARAAYLEVEDKGTAEYLDLLRGQIRALPNLQVHRVVRKKGWESIIMSRSAPGSAIGLGAVAHGRDSVS